MSEPFGRFRRLLRDDNAANDVDQETWMRSLQHRPRQSRSLHAWLVTIARNTRREEAVARPEGVRWNDEYQRQQRDRRISSEEPHWRLRLPYESPAPS